MVDTVPDLLFNFNLNFITFLKLLDGFCSKNPAHDPTVPEGHLEAGHATFNKDLEVLASVPVVVGGDDCDHLFSLMVLICLVGAHSVIP